MTSWHTPYEKTNDESALACNVCAREMKAFFQARGYPEALLNGDLCKISTVSRNEALRPPVERDATESRVPLVLTYNQFNTGTKRILLDNFEMLLSDPATRTIYPELPLVSYRRDRNLRDYFVHSAERTDSDAGTFACRHPRCFTCRHTTSQAILQSPKRLYTIRDCFSPRMWSTPSYVVAAVAYTLPTIEHSDNVRKVRWPTGATATHCKTNTFRIKTLLSLCNCSCFPYKYKPVA